MSTVRTSYQIEEKIDKALSLCPKKDKDQLQYLNELKDKITRFNEFPGSEKEAIEKLLEIGHMLIEAIYYSEKPPVLQMDLKLTEAELFKGKHELLSHPAAEAFTELVAMEKACGDFKKPNKLISKFFSSSQHQVLLKDGFEILRYLLFKIMQKNSSTNKTKRSQLLKDLNVSVILPMHQKLDYRLSDGGCIGYAMIFLQSMLNQKLPFGIQSLENLPFDSISDYVFVNHLVPFNPKISEAHAIYNNADQNRINQFNEKNFIKRTQNDSFTVKMTAPKDIKEKLMAVIQNAVQIIDHKKNTTNAGILLRLVNPQGEAHGVALYADKMGFHFLDANFGWLHFKKQNDLLIFLNRLLERYVEAHKFNSVTFTQYTSTRPAVKKSFDSSPKKNIPQKLFQSIPSSTEATVGLDIDGNKLKTTMHSAEKSFALQDNKEAKEEKIVPPPSVGLKRRGSVF